MSRDAVNFWAFWVGVALAWGILTSNAFALSPPSTVTDNRAWVHYYGVSAAPCKTAAELCILDAALASEAALRESNVLVDDVQWDSVDPVTCADPAVTCTMTVRGTYQPTTSAGAPNGARVSFSTSVGGIGADAPSSNPCTATAGQVVSSGLYDLGTDPEALPPTTTCDGQCELSYTGSGVVTRQLVGGAWHYFSQGSYTSTSSSCTGATSIDGSPSLPAPSCDPATQDQGTVNGRFVCLDKSTTKTTTETPPVTNPDGSTTTTKTTDNGDGTQTVETTNTATDGTKTTSTVTEPVPGSSEPFCVANPSHESCRKDDVPWGDIPEQGLIPVHEVETSTAYDVMGGEGQCPADQTVSFMGQSLTWSYAPICTFAQAIRPLVIGLSWLSFGLILVGGLGRAK